MIFAGHPLIDANGSEKNIAMKVIAMGDWNMDADSSLTVPHGLSLSNIIFAWANIRNDDDTAHYTIQGFDVVGLESNLNAIDATNVNIIRKVGGFFDGTDFDATDYNRGWIYIIYTF